LISIEQTIEQQRSKLQLIPKDEVIKKFEKIVEQLKINYGSEGNQSDKMALDCSEVVLDKVKRISSQQELLQYIVSLARSTYAEQDKERRMIMHQLGSIVLLIKL
jgi:hypothetical protein